MKEIYMDIKGYEGKYQVSNLGNVKNSKGQVLKPQKNKYGYMRVGLFKDGKLKKYFVHRLVLETFKANPDNKPQVNHKDENKENNNLNNLEWCTAKENVNHGKHNERVSKSMKIAAIKYKKKVYCNELNKTFDSATDAAKWLGKESARGHITNCCTGKEKSCEGYTWCYADNSEK